jgi:hypothetical protein
VDISKKKIYIYFSISKPTGEGPLDVKRPWLIKQMMYEPVNPGVTFKTHLKSYCWATNLGGPPIKEAQIKAQQTQSRHNKPKSRQKEFRCVKIASCQPPPEIILGDISID